MCTRHNHAKDSLQGKQVRLCRGAQLQQHAPQVGLCAADVSLTSGVASNMATSTCCVSSRRPHRFKEPPTWISRFGSAQKIACYGGCQDAMGNDRARAAGALCGATMLCLWATHNLKGISAVAKPGRIDHAALRRIFVACCCCLEKARLLQNACQPIMPSWHDEHGCCWNHTRVLLGVPHMCGSSQSVHELSMQRLCCQLVCSFCLQSLVSRELHLVLADNLYDAGNSCMRLQYIAPCQILKKNRTKVMHGWYTVKVMLCDQAVWEPGCAVG